MQKRVDGLLRSPLLQTKGRSSSNLPIKLVLPHEAETVEKGTKIAAVTWYYTTYMGENEKAKEEGRCLQ